MQLLVSHLLLVLLLGIVLSAAISSFVALGHSVDRVLEGNYESIVAAEEMRAALAGDEESLTYFFAGRKDEARYMSKAANADFGNGFDQARGSINNRAEDETVARIEVSYRTYRDTLERVFSSPPDSARSIYLIELGPLQKQLELNLAELTRINQEAMFRESNHAKMLVSAAAVRSLTWTGVTLVVAIALTILLSRSLLRPLQSLTKKAAAIGAGDLSVRVQWKRADEFGALGETFNEMADKLVEARDKDQRRIQKAKKMVDQALESLYDPVIITDSKGHIVHLNKAAEGLFGPSPANAPRIPIVDHVGDQRIVRAINKAVKQDAVSDSEDEATLIPLQVAGTNRTYRLRANPIKSDDGSTLGSVAVLEDITHLKEVDRLKSEFISVASHELRTPVGSLLMSVELLEEGALGELTPSQKEVVALQKQDLERLERLMHELLDITKLEAGTSPPRFQMIPVFDLAQGALQATRAAAEKKEIGLMMDVSKDLKPVRADRSQIERVLVNLISNAIRHTPAGGHVKVRAASEGNQVTFTVEDDGEGIPKEYLGQIFDRFVQVPGATSGGAGLGLAIAYNIVKAHGGNIWVESELGQGSAFHFTLPTDAQPLGDTAH